MPLAMMYGELIYSRCCFQAFVLSFFPENLGEHEARFCFIFSIQGFLASCCFIHITPLKFNIDTLPETNSSLLKMMVGIRSFPLGFRPIFRGKLAVSFREGTPNSDI